MPSGNIPFINKVVQRVANPFVIIIIGLWLVTHMLTKSSALDREKSQSRDDCSYVAGKPLNNWRKVWPKHIPRFSIPENYFLRTQNFSQTFFASLYPTVHKTITITFLSTDKRYSVPKTKVVNFMCILLHLLGFLAPLSFYDFATSAWLTHFKNKAASSALFPFKKKGQPHFEK